MEYLDGWVIGQGGMLGHAVVSALALAPGLRVHRADQRARIIWSDPDLAAPQLRSLVAEFFASTRRVPWAIFWCAGSGIVGASEDSLRCEQLVLDHLLRAVGEYAPTNTPGLFFFASSAGGLYGGAKEDIISEASPVAPINAYGRAKLVQEQTIAGHALPKRNVSVVIGRISTLYGAAQNLRKSQGLISQLIRSSLLGYPAHVFVPLDTRRDFHWTDDCADQIVLACTHVLERSISRNRAEAITRIFAAEKETSIAEVIGVLRRISKRPVRLVVAPSRLAAQHARSQRFRSIVLRDLPYRGNTALHEGIHRIWQTLDNELRAGRLEMPRGTTTTTR
jgi:UDP-glucose 4-epimerase